MQSWHTCHVQLSWLLRLATRWVSKSLHVHGIPAASVRTHVSHQPVLVGGVCLTLCWRISFVSWKRLWHVSKHTAAAAAGPPPLPKGLRSGHVTGQRQHSVLVLDTYIPCPVNCAAACSQTSTRTSAARMETHLCSAATSTPGTTLPGCCRAATVQPAASTTS
jgi:hypothetical protein